MHNGFEATSLGHISLSQKTIPGITCINTIDTLFFNSIQQRYKFLVDINIPSYSSKKMAILNDLFPACILAFASKRWYCILLELLYAKFCLKCWTILTGVYQQDVQATISLLKFKPQFCCPNGDTVTVSPVCVATFNIFYILLLLHLMHVTSPYSPNLYY